MIRNADILAENDKTAEAKELYLSVLGAESADDFARKCAAIGLGRIALDEKKPATNAVLSADSSWTAFVKNFVTPIWSLLLPFLVTMAVLLFLAKAVTRFFVDPSANGPKNRRSENRALWWYALFGWGPMLIASGLLILAVPGAGERSDQATAWILLPAGILVIAVSVAASCILRGTVGGSKWQRMRAWAWTMAAVGISSVVVAVGSWLLGRRELTTLAVAVLAAAVGVLIAGYFRGIRQDMVIEGRKADGADDAGLAQALQAALNGVGSIPPRGVLSPINTDVSALQKDALAVLPDGSWAKIATFLVSLVTPSRPWRVAVSHLDMMSINVVLTRNGRAAESQVIRSGDYGWLPISSEIESADAKDDGSAQLSIDLCRAAAAFIILALSDRHPELKQGLNGATRWRSVAAQVVATTPRSTSLTQTRRLAVLAYAVAEDSDNLTAQLAFIIERYTQSPDDNDELRKALQALFTRIAGKEDVTRLGEWPGALRALQIRMLFNMSVSLTNEYVGVPGSTANEEALRYLGALKKHLEDYQSDVQLMGLIAETRSSAEYLSAVLDTAVTIDDAGCVGVLAYYEASCAHAHRKERAAALDLLEISCLADTSYGQWARTDPSYADLQAGFGSGAWEGDDDLSIAGGPTFAELQRFRTIVGSEAAIKFLALDSLSKHSEDLTLLGVTSAEAVLSRGKYWLTNEIGISRPMAQRWIDIATMYLALPVQRRSIAFLLLKADVFTFQQLSHLVAAESSRKALADTLAKKAVDGTIVPPSVKALGHIPWVQDAPR